MRTVRADLSRNLKSLEIHIFADWHIGDKSCDFKAIQAEIEAVKDNPNAYVICNGDLMNNATKASVSDCYSEVIPPMEQLQTLCELLEPIKDKILLLTQGNHESRTFRNDGIDLTALMASQLGIYDRYVREGGVLFLRFGEQNNGRHETNGSGNVRKVCYTIYCTHGSGGGRKEGGKINRLADLASIVDTDIYVMSHTHLPVCMKENYFRIDPRNSTIAEVEKLFVNTSAQLGYGGYGESFQFKPASKANPIIQLSGSYKNARVEL